MLVTLRLSLLDGRQRQLSRELPSADASSEQIILWIADRGRVSLGDRESCRVDEIRRVEVVPPPEEETAPPWQEPDQPADVRQLRDEDVAAALRERPQQPHESPARKQAVLGRSHTRGDAMAIMLLHFEVDDYDAWKPMFDQDPVGRAAAGATSHKIARSVDNPNEVFVRVEFPSVDQAQAFRERLVASGAFERGGMRMKAGPTVAESAEERSY